MFVGKKNPTKNTTRLGEILVEAGVIKDDLVMQSLAIAKNSKLPIGRVLSMYGFANEKVIESAVEAQRGLRDGRFNRQQASHLVRVAFTNELNIDQAQSLVGLQHADSSNLCEVGKMLLAAEILDKGVLKQAQAETSRVDQTVGQWLLENEKITSQLLVNVLHLALLCRSEALPKIDAISALQKMHRENISLPEAAAALSLGTLPEQQEIQLVAFMIIAQMVDQDAVMRALEKSLEQKMFFGDVLVVGEVLTLNTLTAAIHLHEMAEHELISVEEACEIFAFVADLNTPLDTLLAEFERMSDIAKFIIKTGYISEDDCATHGLSADSSDIMLGVKILREELADEKIIGHAAYLLDMIRPSDLTEREAIGIFHYCVRFNVTAVEAVEKFDIQNREKQLAPADA